MTSLQRRHRQPPQATPVSAYMAACSADPASCLHSAFITGSRPTRREAACSVSKTACPPGVAAAERTHTRASSARCRALPPLRSMSAAGAGACVPHAQLSPPRAVPGSLPTPALACCSQLQRASLVAHTSARDLHAASGQLNSACVTSRHRLGRQRARLRRRHTSRHATIACQQCERATCHSEHMRVPAAWRCLHMPAHASTPHAACAKCCAVLPLPVHPHHHGLYRVTQILDPAQVSVTCSSTRASTVHATSCTATRPL